MFLLRFFLGVFIMTIHGLKNCTDLSCEETISLPLLDHLKATLKADVDVKDLNKVLRMYIQKEIRKTLLEIKNERPEKEFNDTARNSEKNIEDITEQKQANTSTEFGGKNKSAQDVNLQINKLNSEMRIITNSLETLVKLVRDIKEAVVPPRECNDGMALPGVYFISPYGLSNFKVRCEIGGWTVIQKRFDGSTEFYRNWTDYENGFGDLNREFWLGNKYIVLLTSSGTHKLRVDLEDWSGNKAYAVYKNFKVGDASTKYKLTVSGYSGTAGDGLSYHNGQYFSTYDQDNDRNSGNCAASTAVKGAWWYNSCYYSILNGIYTNGSHSNGGIKWYHWKRSYNSLKKSFMMIRKV